MSLFKKTIIGNDKKKELPPNRFLQFFYLIKENFLLLFYSSLTYFVFLLPLIYILISSYMNYSSLINQENIDSQTLLSSIFASASLLIPCILLLSIGDTGMHYVIKKIAYNEGCLYKDFFIGIKKYFKKIFLYYVLISVFLFLVIINYGCYYFVEDLNPIFKLVVFVICCILFAFSILAKPYFILQKMIFNNTNIQTMKNSLVLAVAKLIPNLLFLLLSSVLYLTLFFFKNYLLALNIVILIIFGGAYSTLITVLNSIDKLEKSIDPNEYKEIYHKGLNYFHSIDKNE